MASIVLSSYGRMFATRGQVGELLGGEADTADAASIMIDASDVYMSPSFIAELLVTLVEEHKYERVLVRGAREHPAKVAQHLATQFGYGDRVEVEQPTVPA